MKEFWGNRSSIGTFQWLTGIQIKPLTRKEEYELLKHKRAGEQVDEKTMDTIIRSNIALIILFVKRDCNLGRSPYLEDAIDVGMQAIPQAMKYFDPSMGNRFMSFARSIIVQNVSDFITKNTTIESRSPNFKKKIILVRKYLKEKELDSLEDSMIEDVVEYANMKRKEVEEVVAYFRRNEHIGDIPEDECEILMHHAHEENQEDFIVDEEKKKLNARLRELLDDREYFVMECSFGLNGKRVMNGVEIGKLFVPKISKQAVNQIYGSAMDKLSEDKTIFFDLDVEAIYDA